MIDTSILEENRRRLAALAADRYDPLTGEGCYGERVAVTLPGSHMQVEVPCSMVADPGYGKLLDLHGFEMLRMRHDFEFWCAKCVTVKDKAGYADIKLRLNPPQRIIYGTLEEMRRRGKPIRAILLKARQCGGSTLVQAYMAWIQLMLRDNWHSLICAHVKDAAATIKGMMSKIALRYPEEYLPDGIPAIRLRPFEGSRNISRIEGRGNTVTICSAENQEAARGTDIAMAHLSEVAFWKETAGHDPNNIIRSVAGSIALADHTLVVLESTANGAGNFFHEEWLRAKAEMSDKRPIFIPWYENRIYKTDVDDYAALWDSLDDYERRLWDMGLALEQIAWYHAKRKEYSSHRAMQAEYPTTDTEAFACTDRMVFDAEGVETLRAGCLPPVATGDISGDAPKGENALRNVRFTPSAAGQLKIWNQPAQTGTRANRYLTIVDVGGRSEASDFSVIAVVDCGEEGCHDDRLMTRCIGLFIAGELRSAAPRPAALKRPSFPPRPPKPRPS